MQRKLTDALAPESGRFWLSLNESTEAKRKFRGESISETVSIYVAIGDQIGIYRYAVN